MRVSRKDLLGQKRKASPKRALPLGSSWFGVPLSGEENIAKTTNESTPRCMPSQTRLQSVDVVNVPDNVSKRGAKAK